MTGRCEGAPTAGPAIEPLQGCPGKTLPVSHRVVGVCSGCEQRDVPFPKMTPPAQMAGDRVWGCDKRWPPMVVASAPAQGLQA